MTSTLRTSKNSRYVRVIFVPRRGYRIRFFVDPQHRWLLPITRVLTVVGRSGDCTILRCWTELLHQLDEVPAVRIAADDRAEQGRSTKSAYVDRHVGGAAKPVFLLADGYDRNRCFRRDPVHVAPEVRVQHHVADHEHVELFHGPEKRIDGGGFRVAMTNDSLPVTGWTVSRKLAKFRKARRRCGALLLQLVVGCGIRRRKQFGRRTLRQSRR